MTYVFDPEQADLTWADLIDETGTVRGKIGAPKELVLAQDLRVVDGWRVAWLMPVMDVDGQRGTSPFPWVVLNVPDYPTASGSSLVMSSKDARSVAHLLIQQADEADRTMKKVRVGVDRRAREAAEEAHRQRVVEGTRCSVDGCRRERHFFDAVGHGYCKRHADERGLRPKGKVR